MAPVHSDHCSALPADSGLRCPKCEYNLTGVAENRCPECGEAFDRQRLETILAGTPSPIRIWDDGKLNPVARFIGVCLMTWFLPGRFSRTFPRRYDRRSAKRFRLWVIIVIALMPFVPIVLARDVFMLGAFVVGASGCIAGFFICEFLVAAEMDAYLSASAPPRSTLFSPYASESFAGLVGMFRSFVLLQPIALITAGLACEFRLLSNELFPILPVSIVAIWWWAALGSAIAAQPGTAVTKINLITLVPVIVFLSTLFGASVGFICFVVVYGLASLFT